MIRELPPIEAGTVHHADGLRVTTATERAYGYVWVTRAHKRRPWTAVAHCWAAGDACLAAAQKHFAAHGYVETDYSTGRVMADYYFHELKGKTV